MKSAALILAVFASFAAGQAMADEVLARDDLAYDRFFLMPNASTLGAGIEGGYRVNETWRVRAGINGLATSYVHHDKDSDLDSHLMLLNGGAKIDYFPFAGDFFVSGGINLSANRIEGKVKNLKASVRRGGDVDHLFVKDPLTDFTVRQNVVQPYLGAGYTVQIKKRISLNFDLGALYAGSPSLDVRSRATELGFTRDQIRHEIDRARDRLAPFKFYPVVQIGLKVQF